ncbi:nucleoside triphosphate hydrolase [Deinococcus indicus]|uniref:Nucleoside triphosphate hydrolase n=1 Tax=Deinococcus indicus TaxID=223556 RepID=A0A246BGN6_9DEIO|nr:MazG family protein [Deinococcus indicus]OWL94391.1 nucleoside triphosphate hydrolase [Deinococcus indicus]GHG14634.1 nucleoside triphosphate pyrophosphohydrolase [Deinococcus indicus]
MQDLLTIMRRLRAPDGCPWDQEQTHDSLRPYLLEEAAEAADAAGSGDPAALSDELGDVLLQVAFHSVIAEEAGTFDYAAVERGIVEKLVRRHPHVFGEASVQDSADVMRTWQAIKAQERGGRPRRPEDRVPAGLGALAREAKTQKLAGVPKVPAEQARAAVTQAATQAPDTAQGVADVLAAVVTWARSVGVDPELVLRDHSRTTLRALPGTEDT